MADPKSRHPGGRPRSVEARETFQFRALAEQRDEWQQSAKARGQSESQWARDGLQGWVTVCQLAQQLGVEPVALLSAALQDHLRIVGAIAELELVPSLAASDKDRLLRVLAPEKWAGRNSTK